MQQIPKIGNSSNNDKFNLDNIDNIIRLPQIVPIVENIKKISASKSTSDINNLDFLSSQIVTLSVTLEELYNNFDMGYMIKDVCGIVTKILEHLNLGRYVYLPYRLLDDRFKRKNKDTMSMRYNNNPNNNILQRQDIPQVDQPILEQDPILSQILISKIQYTYQDLEEAVDLSTMSTEDLQTAYGCHRKIDNFFRSEFEKRGIELDEDKKASSALENLQQIEKQRFKKAEIGKPIKTVEELTEDEEYNIAFESLKKVIKTTQKAFDRVYDWFIVRYPPLDIENVKKLTESFNGFLELFRPFFDDKYRLDHYKALYLTFEKILQTSQKASKLSRVMCAHMVDKHGNPLWRGVTKEQIDASYVWEINFWRDLINKIFWFVRHMSEANAGHGERVKADRAVALSDTLSHHA